MSSKRSWASLAGFAIAALAIGQAPVFGPEFQVNTTTASYQYAPSVANIGPTSNFVIVWSSDGQDGDHTGAVGRLFDAAGTPLAGEFAINAATTGYQDRVLVGSNAAGNFVVAWTEFVSYDASYEIRARRFNASGTPQGGDIVVNTYTTGTQVASPVALDSAGNFVVVWSERPRLPDQPAPPGWQRFRDLCPSIRRERQPALGGVPGEPVHDGQSVQPAHRDEPGRRLHRGLDQRPSGRPVVVDHGEALRQRRGTSRRRVPGQYARGELPARGRRGARSGGSAIVVWQSNEQDGSDMGVYGQRFDASGNKLGPEFNVNTFTRAIRRRPRVVAGFGGFDPGEFAVIWHSPGRGRERCGRVRAALRLDGPALRRGASGQQLHGRVPGLSRARRAAQRAIRRGVAERRKRRLGPGGRGPTRRRPTRGAELRRHRAHPGPASDRQRQRSPRSRERRSTTRPGIGTGRPIQ